MEGLGARVCSLRVDMGIPVREGMAADRLLPTTQVTSSLHFFSKSLTCVLSGDYRGESSFRDQTASRRQFDEYDAGDDEDAAPRRSTSISQPSRSNTLSSRTEAPAAPPAPKQPVQDLLGGFDDEPVMASAPPAAHAASGGDCEYLLRSVRAAF